MPDLLIPYDKKPFGAFFICPGMPDIRFKEIIIKKLSSGSAATDATFTKQARLEGTKH